MENKALTIDTGLVTYDLNGKVTLTFNPTDTAFVERLFDVFTELDKKQEEYRARVEKADTREIFGIVRECDAEMRELIDGAFCVPVCDALFGEMSVYSLAGGAPLWANLLLAVLDEIDTSFAAEQRKSNERIRKYSAKYKK